MKAWKVIKCPLLHFSHKEAEIREWVARVCSKENRIPALWAIILTLIGLIHHHVFLTNCELKHCNLINTPHYVKVQKLLAGKKKKKTAKLFLGKSRNQYINSAPDLLRNAPWALGQMSLNTKYNHILFFNPRVDIHVLQMVFQIIFPSNLDGQQWGYSPNSSDICSDEATDIWFLSANSTSDSWFSLYS